MLQRVEKEGWVTSKKLILRKFLARRSGLGRIIEFVVPFQNAIPYTQVPQVEEQF